MLIEIFESLAPGKKSYIVGGLIIGTTACYACNLIDEHKLFVILGILNGAGVAALKAATKRVE